MPGVGGGCADTGKATAHGENGKASGVCSSTIDICLHCLFVLGLRHFGAPLSLLAQRAPACGRRRLGVPSPEENAFFHHVAATPPTRQLQRALIRRGCAVIDVRLLPTVSRRRVDVRPGV